MRHRPLRCRSGHFRSRGRHRRDVPLSWSIRLLDRGVSRQPRIRGQTPFRQTPKGKPASPAPTRRMRVGRVTHSRLSAKSLPLACPQVRRLTQPDREEQSHRRRRPQTGHHHLARACHRQTLHRPRRRLLRPPNRPRERNPPTHRQTPGPRTHRHHRTRSLKPPNHQIRLRRMASPCPVTLDSRTSHKSPTICAACACEA